MSRAARVASLHLYPVKACAGTDLDVAELGARGVVGDRAFAVIDAGQEVITQREHPVLATVRPTFRDHVLSLAGPAAALAVRECPDGPRLPMTVFGRPCFGVDQGDDAAAWFTDVTGAPCRLVRCPPDGGKPVDPAYASGEVAYADGYPVSVISTASLARLADEILEMGEEPVPVNRFRANIVLTGWKEPHTEDEVARMSLGTARLRLIGRDGRCVVTTIDQRTGERTRQPLRALGRYRRIEGSIKFGMYAMVERPGTTRIGDEVLVED